MIVTEKYYNIRCDCCGEILDDSEYYSTKEELDEVMFGLDWIEHKGKHYCPNCYSYDDKDNLIINEENRKI